MAVKDAGTWKLIRNVSSIPFLIIVLLLSIILAISYGSVVIETEVVYRILLNKLTNQGMYSPNWESSMEVIIWDFRLPRVIMAAITGSILSLVGIFMQTLTRNPLAEPYLLGVSSGASAGAVSTIIFGTFAFFGREAVQAGAFLGAFSALFALLVFAGGRKGVVRLILIGVGISAFFCAVTTLLLYMAKNDSQLRSAMFWMVGSFTSVAWEDVYLPGFLALLSLGGAMSIRKELDLLLMGDATARHLGVPVNTIQWTLIIIASLVVAAVVAKVGVIGFVGLIIPHVSRKFFGMRHYILLPSAALLGGIFLVWADTIARTCFSPEELPVGVVTALAGAPIFIWIIRKN